MKTPAVVVSTGLLTMAIWAALGLQSSCGHDAEPTALCPDIAVDGRSPIAHGRSVLADALAQAGLTATVRVTLASEPCAAQALAAAGVAVDARAESFAVLPRAGATLVVGRDPVGAMYGLMEVAERAQLDGAAALPVRQPRFGAPVVPVRAANLFLVLPVPGETSWWFLDEKFWVEYLDLLARARMNYLDMHGMYNTDNTIFPNVLPHFATSSSHPEIGIESSAREQNLAMLNHIIELSTERGIRVGLMSYGASASTTGDDSPSISDADLKVYTREAAADLAKRASGLWRLGFRIGESGRDASWLIDTFVAGVHEAGTGVKIATRTWGASKADILKVVDAAGPDTMVQSKYNGEHFALPYPIAGGLMANGPHGWAGYSYQDFLNPPHPYTFVFQIRAGGTHRIFRYASFERTRRTVGTVLLGGALGYTLEPTHAYYPQRDFYHANPEDRFSDWTFRRDELEYLLFGRLGYDPSTPERPFRAALARRVGTDAFWDPVQAASEIVPWIQTAHTFGPDQRNFAPELEWGGPVGYWMTASDAARDSAHCPTTGYHGPFDTFAVASAFDAAQDLVSGRATTRVSPREVANLVLASSDAARGVGSVSADPGNAEARDVARECAALADLGTYFGHKLRSALALAIYAQTGSADYLASARAEIKIADDGWKALASDAAYLAPFVENLRMGQYGLVPFHWKDETTWLEEDATSIDRVAADVDASPPAFAGTLPPASWLGSVRSAGPGLGSLAVEPMDASASAWTVTVTLAKTLAPGGTVRVLYKSFDGNLDWNTTDASGSETTFTATVPGNGLGALFAVEVENGLEGWRYPDMLTETPYRVLPPGSPGGESD